MQEHRAFILQANAQDLRIRHDEIIASWKARTEREGLDNLIAERCTAGCYRMGL